MIVEPDPRFVEFRRTAAHGLRNQLVEDNRRLANFVAQRYAARGVPDDDLRQVAYVGLINAVNRFDPDMGTRFATFAGRTIEGELKRHFRDRTWMVRVPRGAKDLSLAVRRAIDRMSVELGRTPRADEVAQALDVSEDAVIEALDVSAAYSVDSLDRPSGQEGVNVGDGLGGEDPGFASFENDLSLVQLLALLPEQQRRIMEMRVYQDLSQSEIALRVGISQMHVSRLLRRSFEQLRHLVQT